MKIGVVGAGRLGLCLALNIEREGFPVYAIDISEAQVNAINNRQIKSNEPNVQKYLAEAKHLQASTDISLLEQENVDVIFICVQTPSNEDGGYDHSSIDQCVNELSGSLCLSKRTDIVINATTMPGYCESLQSQLHENIQISYNPEFIAQGSIIKDQQYPDQILIGEADKAAGDRIEQIYRKMCKNNPTVSRMSRTGAEITKLSINCFLTTKIAFANSVGDLCGKFDVDEKEVLTSIGSDERIGSKFLSYGFGFGGPCLPRDNRALGKAAESVGMTMDLSEATDRSNARHLQAQLESYLRREEPIRFESITYKKGVDIIEESQQLALAVLLMKKGKQVQICASSYTISKVKELYGDHFLFEVHE